MRIGKMFINVNFKTFIYDNKKEKRKHEIEMISDGWRIDSEEKLKICWRKSEIILDKKDE